MSSKSSTNTKKPACAKIIYFDNNSTTLIFNKARDVYSQWLNCYNASSDSRIARPAKLMIDNSCDAILAHCGVSSATHKAVFTSGATESNCLILRMCVKAYKKKLIERNSNLVPHVVVSATEHHSILECLKDLMNCGHVTVSYVAPTIFGNILPEDVEKEIKPNTCLISIMYANNELPVINNVHDIGNIAHKHQIPLHSDCVQIFGKYKIDMKKSNIDALSASAHKFYGPKGTGVLIINNDLIEGYGLTGEINGTQQNGLRGGTENVAGIASMMAALKWAFTQRKQKNSKLFKLRNYTLESLQQHFTFGDYSKYVYFDESKDEKQADIELISLGPPADKLSFILPNTILLAICKNKGKPFCNVDLKKYLDNKGIVVSIGSACLTTQEKASHVLTAIGAPPVVKRGVIRISFSDVTTNKEIDIFVKTLTEGIKKQCVDL